jgi:hypothetical protein
MTTVFLPVGSLLYFDTGTDLVTPTWSKLTEHNRQPASIQINRIEKTQRTSNGTMRKFFIADKKSISVSWNMIPTHSTMTVDGGYGANDIQTFYNSAKGQGSFKIKISYSPTREETMEVIFSSCSFDVIKRNVKAKSSDPAQEFWDVSISLEQV